MYVFQPGAGCSGPSVKVDPGFELNDTTQTDLFSGQLLNVDASMSEVMDFQSEVSVVLPEIKLEVMDDKSQKRNSFVFFFFINGILL